MKYLIVLLASFIFIVPNLHAQKTATYNGVQEAVEEGELRILSWNIKMLPRLIKRVRVGPIKRSRIIPQVVIDDQIDIIVFQEAFDVRSRRIIKRRIKKEYPYKAGPANKKFFRIKTNSGILIYSKLPLMELGTVKYDQCTGSDCLAFKGALLVEAEFEGQRFQVLGTHLNAGGDYDVKRSQYSQIKGLVNKYKREGVPQFLVGDFNTHKSRKRPELYKSMIDSLEAEDGEILSELKFTADELRNDLNPAGTNGEANQSVIDYILVRKNGVDIEQMDRYVRQYQVSWRVDHSDLSDHNAVLMKLKF